jgi:tetratricopeptide (TPR) repeat protein
MENSQRRPADIIDRDAQTPQTEHRLETKLRGTQSTVQCPTVEVLNYVLAGETIDDVLAEHISQCGFCQHILDRLSNDTPLSGLRNRFDPSGVVATWLDPPIQEGDLGTLAGFRIQSQIAVGGMGVVYRGFDDRMGRQVAVKVLKRFDQPQSAERFLRETRATAKLQHDHVVAVFESGLARDGRPYLIMPLVEGETLAQRIRRLSIEPHAAAQVIRQIALALGAAHDAGLIHRDVKPANIMLDTTDGRAKLTDFGLVRVIDDATLTQADVLAGTPEYMSPEQSSGAEKIDLRTDIYSLGVTLYECLTGTVPYRGRPLEVLNQHRNSTPIPPAQLHRSVDDNLNTMCLKCLAREPERRYQTANELADDLQRYLNGIPILAKPVSAWTRLVLWAGRNPAVAASLGVVFATLLVCSVVSTWLWLQSVAHARQAQKLADELGENQQQLQTALVISESQRIRAEQRFDDLRNLANELLFEIYPQVEYLENSLAARQKIITSALQYLDHLHQESSDDLELQSELATAYEKIGELVGAIGNTNLGDKRAGLDNYYKARELRQAVFESDPLNPQNIESLANNYYVVARTLWAADFFTESSENFQTSIRLQRNLLAAKPDSEAALNRLATILIDSANIPSWDGLYDQAHQIYDEAQRILDDLIARSPENLEYKKTITRLLRAISRIHMNTGNVAAGETALLKAIDLGKQLIDAYPDDFSVARSVWISRYLLGELYVKNKLLEKAVAACKEAIEFPQSTHQREPTNAFVAVDLANAYFNTARSYRNLADFRSARLFAEHAVEVMRGLIDAHPDDQEYQRNLAIYLIEIARAHVELDDYQDALEANQRAIQLLEPLALSSSASAYSLYDLAAAHRTSAKAYHCLEDHEQAVHSINEAIRLLEQLRETGSQQVTPRLMEELMEEQRTYADL